MSDNGAGTRASPSRESGSAAAVELLRELHARDVERAPTQHSDRTADCLPLWMVGEASNRGFADSQLAHVPTCRFCQKLLAMAWRLECPGIRLLLLHLGPSSPVSEAMVEHVELDACPRCTRLTNSRLLRALASRLGSVSEHASMKEVELCRAGADFGFLPTEVGAFAPSPWARAAEPTRESPEGEGDEGEPLWPFRLRVVAPGGMVTTLRETDQDTLVVHIHSADPADAGRTVNVEVAGDGASLEASVVLHRSGPRYEGRYTFGQLTHLRPLLGGSCALVVASQGEPSSVSRG